ncbi:3234_t:CDS:2 [Acaulospora morrowiae]|uniref:3234_t:CDS:1 n=1 Tax=Acaulospora morrowiae TaxID=94023 RepID=A0A9N9ABG4_9GLOM|nr:3234_t:CDS:2 [Acaulospora morrowiae]
MVAQEQSGILSGHNPMTYNKNDPIVLFIVQVISIIVVTRAIYLALMWFRQPRVIAEVIGGIVLGPSVLGRIPGFEATLFPVESMPNLNLLANLGLVLYLFIIGVELNPRLLLKNVRVALTISAAGIAFPFILGIGVGYGMYKSLNNDGVSFTSFLLFIGVAMSITAFPVLARILSELRLLRTPVGFTALTAGVGDDVAAWILLALVVSIINSSNNLNALYVLLLAIAWVGVAIFIIRPILLKLIVRTGSENGPTMIMMAITLCLVLISAFYTDIIGIHSIFGGFIIGVIIPHEGGFAVGITEKIEDLISVLLLPIYFTLSGLRTEIGLLNDATSWGFVILVIVIAMFGKITGCALAARLNKLEWRESLTIGIFMSCKGLVELIVLNIGYEAKILNPKVFVIMVVMALITTFLTTPLATYVYPYEYQKKMEIRRAKARDSEQGQSQIDGSHKGDDAVTFSEKKKLMVVVNKVEDLPAMMTLVQILQSQFVLDSLNSEKSEKQPENQIEIRRNSSQGVVHVLRLVQLTQRISAVMKFNETEETILHDPIMNVFRAFGRLNLVKVKANLAVTARHEFHQQVLENARENDCNMVVIPWGGAGAIVDNPADPLEDVLGPRQLKETSPQHAHFIQESFHHLLNVSPMAVFIDRGLGVSSEHGALDIHIFLPFFGGSDDREALSFVIRLLDNPHITVSVLKITRSLVPTHDDVILQPSTLKEVESPAITVEEGDQRPSLPHRVSTASAHVLHSSALDESHAADKALLAQYLKLQSTKHTHAQFAEVISATPLQTAVERAKNVVGTKDLVVLGRGRQEAAVNHRGEFLEVIKNIGISFGGDTRKSLGDVAVSFLVGEVASSILVIQSKKSVDAPK